MIPGTAFNTAPPKNALIPNKLKMQSKGIKSIRARVTNIKEHLSLDLDIMAFKKGLEQKLLQFCSSYENRNKEAEECHGLNVCVPTPKCTH